MENQTTIHRLAKATEMLEQTSQTVDDGSPRKLNAETGKPQWVRGRPGQLQQSNRYNRHIGLDTPDEILEWSIEWKLKKI